VRYGHGAKADRLLAELVEEIAENPGFQNVAVFTLSDEATTFVRGLNTNRLDGYGITKAHVTLAKRELAKVGVALPFDEVDGLLHHAEAHRTGSCPCGTEPSRMTSAEKMRAFRARAREAGYCVVGGSSHGKATRGTTCEACLTYNLARKRKKHAEAKSTCQKTPPSAESAWRKTERAGSARSQPHTAPA
jgi:hypothetical protein